VVDWEATSEEEMRVQAVVLLLPAVDPAGGRSSSSAGGGGRAMEMLLQLVAPKSPSLVSTRVCAVCWTLDVERMMSFGSTTGGAKGGHCPLTIEFFIYIIYIVNSLCSY